MQASAATSHDAVHSWMARAPHESRRGSGERSLREQSFGELLRTILTPCYADLSRSRTDPDLPALWSLHDIHEMLQKKLRWYGWGSINIGPFELMQDNVLVSLMRDGKIYRRLKVDRQTGAVRLDGRACIRLYRPPRGLPGMNQSLCPGVSLIPE